MLNAEKILRLVSGILNNKAEAERYLLNPQQYLEGIKDLTPAEMNEAYRLLSPVLEFQKYQIDMLESKKISENRINEVNDSFRDGITEANKQTIRGFSYTMLMYQVAFYFGILMLLASLAFALITNRSLFPILFGSVGTLTILAFFITKPPQQLQESRSKQVQLNAAFYSWFIELYNWNSYYVQFGAKGEQVTLEDMTTVSNLQIDHTERLMKLISERLEN